MNELNNVNNQTKMKSRLFNFLYVFNTFSIEISIYIITAYFQL